MSCVTCHVFCVTCYMSGVTCHFFFSSFFRTKWWSLSVEGLLSTGPTPSSSLINKVTQSSFSSKSSKYPHSQIVRARDLKCWDNVHHPLCVTCHLSHVTHQRSGVKWQVIKKTADEFGFSKVVRTNTLKPNLCISQVNPIKNWACPVLLIHVHGGLHMFLDIMELREENKNPSLEKNCFDNVVSNFWKKR